MEWLVLSRRDPSLVWESLDPDGARECYSG